MRRRRAQLRGFEPFLKEGDEYQIFYIDDRPVQRRHELRELRIETSGEIDLRGFLGLDDSVKPGYDQLSRSERGLLRDMWLKEIEGLERETGLDLAQWRKSIDA